MRKIVLTAALFLALISPCRAESIYLQMPIIPNNPVYTFEDFKARYLELTEEGIQLKPPKNAQGTHYLIGSTRITQDMADQLASEFPMVTITNGHPAGFVYKIEGIQ